MCVCFCACVCARACVLHRTEEEVEVSIPEGMAEGVRLRVAGTYVNHNKRIICVYVYLSYTPYVYTFIYRIRVYDIYMADGGRLRMLALGD